MTGELMAQLGSMNPSSLGGIARQSAMQFKNARDASKAGTYGARMLQVVVSSSPSLSS